MSRVGNAPVNLPAGVDVKINDNVVTVKGPKGELTQEIDKDIIIEINDNVLEVKRPNDDKKYRSLHGLSRALIQNMVTGVTDGFEKKLEIVGVGYRAQKQGKTLVLSLGYSHPVEMEDPEGIETVVDGQTTVIVKGIDKQVVGAHAANIRAKRSPEPYKGKGVRYADEFVRIKEGKSGK
ncbi:50S ribosomal protein L6 [Anaerofustis stercorihominis]|uniref:Large ribosomal subunit protein uL6 n=2 Tax=Anaerofustis stercorihominis TaxID=214853 RepID=B1CA30_9FIRM|nr:50S ribosomal protein L6 [Anaerofustis stercorihominis]EDS72348.1 ribosomal protein L6 [Anaerofustis stercorihominis DSM 17244]MCQ4795508.1 50S ribosomal protein L6 [Anaerofustis stercorihominis]RGD73061.1 50S ribosomal protein L6 [Anaerofustis stercorihominis]